MHEHEKVLELLLCGADTGIGQRLRRAAHELLWTRRLIDLLGASAASSTRVFSCFFLGLALGAAVTPLLLRRVRRPWLSRGTG